MNLYPTSWSTGTGPTWLSTITTTTSGGAGFTPYPVQPAKSKTALDRLADQVEETCARAREAA